MVGFDVDAGPHKFKIAYELKTSFANWLSAQMIEDNIHSESCFCVGFFVKTHLYLSSSLEYIVSDLLFLTLNHWPLYFHFLRLIVIVSRSNQINYVAYNCIGPHLLNPLCIE